jgi:hypothetical protein
MGERRLLYGDVAKWQGRGLQNPDRGFKSRRRLLNTALLLEAIGALGRGQSAIASCVVESWPADANGERGAAVSGGMAFHRERSGM